jgi:hypothetical protein
MLGLIFTPVGKGGAVDALVNAGDDQHRTGGFVGKGFGGGADHLSVTRVTRSLLRDIYPWKQSRPIDAVFVVPLR